MGILGTLDNFTAKFLQEIIAELRFLGLAQCCHIIQRHKRKKKKAKLTATAPRVLAYDVVVAVDETHCASEGRTDMESKRQSN